VDGAVVVGVDGSPGSLAAVVVAAGEALARGRPLRVVHATDEPAEPVEPPGTAADEVLAEAVETASSTTPGLQVTGEVVQGRPAAVLREESRGATLVAVGDRGLGELAELVVGSVAAQLAEHAECPVLVVRGDPARDGDVLVGVDGTAQNEPAVAFAFEEAALQRVGVVAVHAWTPPLAARFDGDREDALGADAARLLTDALSGWQEQYPGVSVQRSVVQGHAGETLVEASRRARLAVVGAGSRGELADLLLGSVSHHLLHHADCPLVIVRGPAD
jgi:nucleotide-binding universal stress UspA family protein